MWLTNYLLLITAFVILALNIQQASRIQSQHFSPLSILEERE